MNLPQNFTNKLFSLINYFRRIFFNNFANLLKLRNSFFQGILSVAASVFVYHFAIFEGVTYCNKTIELLQIYFFL